MQNEITEGQVLAGKYRVERVLGRGGMGIVVAAHHIQLDERVAIKFLLPEAAGNPEALARFAREARAAVKIKSEHVARVSDVGTLEDGAPYMVMEYLEGGDLSDWLQRKGRLPIDQAAQFILQACEAIAEAHSIGIVHRDLKPANLFVIRTPSGALSVKVLDFGISKVTRFGTSAPDAAMTKTSVLMGSPLYMSPEQLQSSKDVDARSDIWALGVILYELISGQCPFGGDTLPELVARILSTSPTTLRSNLSAVPDGLEAVILKCLERDRSKRYESVAALAVALLPFAPPDSRISVTRISGLMHGQGVGVVPHSPAESAVGMNAGTQASWGRTGTAGTRKTTRMVGIAAVMLLSAGGVGLFVARRSVTALPEVPKTVSEPTVLPKAAPRAEPPPTVLAAKPAAENAEVDAAPVASVPATPLAQPQPSTSGTAQTIFKARPALPVAKKNGGVSHSSAAPSPPADPSRNPLKMKIE